MAISMKLVFPNSINNEMELVKLCIEMENEISDNEILPIKGRMSILFALAITENNTFFFFRTDISPNIRQKITTISPQAIISQIDVIKQLLSNYDCDEHYWGKSYIFKSIPSPDDYKDVIIVDHDNDPLFVIKRNGMIVSKAWTWGRNEIAVEVEVETTEAYRGMGYGKQTVSAWAAWHQQIGLIPFFSHELTNIASARLAEKLDLMNFASILLFYEKRRRRENGETA